MNSHDRLPCLLRALGVVLAVGCCPHAPAFAQDAPPPPDPQTAPQPAPRHPVDRATELLSEVVPHVEAACGAEFVRPPKVAVLTATAARVVFKTDLEREYLRRYAGAPAAVVQRALSLGSRTSVQSCVARYSFSERAVVLVKSSFDRQREAVGMREDQAAEFLQAVLAHEAVHALDDQLHGLAALYDGAQDNEHMRAIAMVAEGRAVHFGRQAGAALELPPAIRDLLPGGASPRGEGAWQLNLTYGLGAAFVADILRRGGQELCDRALKDGPRVTHLVCQPARWPEGAVDPKPAEVIAAAALGAEPAALSELQLRARYAALHGREEASRLFAGYRGGMQVIWSGTNLAVLAFADDDAAQAYTALSAQEAPTHRAERFVLRAIGENASAGLDRLEAALRAASATREEPR